MTIFWIDSGGVILSASSNDGIKPDRAVSGIFDGSGSPPRNTISGPSPESGEQVWLGVAWSVLPPPLPDPVIALDAAIDAAANLTDLKSALRGRVRAR